MCCKSKNSAKYSKYETLTQFEILKTHIFVLAHFEDVVLREICANSDPVRSPSQNCSPTINTKTYYIIHTIYLPYTMYRYYNYIRFIVPF